MKSQRIWKYILVVLAISVALGILIHFENIISNLLPESGVSQTGRRHNITDTGLDVFISSMVAFITFMINYFLLRPFDRNIRLSLRRILISATMTIVSVTILSDLLFSLRHLGGTGFNPGHFRLLYTFRDLFMAIVVITGVYFIKTISLKQAVEIENERLRNENILSQFESLKNQVSPHFLFNSLTALRELISQDPEKAQNYVIHLSSVMRYTIQNNESLTKSLKDELQLADSYMFLAKIRYGNNLKLVSKIDTTYNYHLLPPLAIQTLIENAIKHNEISKRNPLEIRIETTDKPSLKVINTLKEKHSPEPGTGSGLMNISRQYSILTGMDISIHKNHEVFLVELPLIKPDRNESHDSRR